MKNIFILAVCYCCLNTSLSAQPGALDTTFANKGKFLMPENNYSNTRIEVAQAVLVQPNGKIIMISSGFDYSSGFSPQFAVVRLSKDGELDNSFGNNGKVFIKFSSDDFGYDWGVSASLLPNGKIVVIGNSYSNIYDPSTDTYSFSDIAIAVLNTDGSLDKSFDVDGKKTIDLSKLHAEAGSYNYDIASAIAVQPDGKIVIAGGTYFSNVGHYVPVFFRLNADGSFDNSFGSGGMYMLDRPEKEDVINGIAIQHDGKVVGVGFTSGHDELGYWTSDLLAIRLQANGTADQRFDGDGIASFDLQGPLETGHAVALQADGKILISGSSDHINSVSIALLRLNANGSLDNSFDADGMQFFSQQNENNYDAKGLAVSSNGKIIQSAGVISQFPQYNGNANFEVIRYNKDGSLDSNFGQHGRSIVDMGNWTDQAYDVMAGCALQQNGDIVVAGGSTQSLYYGPVAVRLLAKGKLVTLDGPPHQTAQAGAEECGVVIENIDPIVMPSDKEAVVTYTLYGATTGSGTGTVSGKQFNIGDTYVVYTLASNQLQRVGFNVTVTGGTPGGALDFDGVDDYVDLPDLSYSLNDGSSEYTFEAWIKVRGYTNDDGTGSWIFGNERNFNGGIQVQLDIDGYVTTFHPALGFVKSAYKVPLETWTHIAFVQSSTNLDLYVNGVFVQTMLTAPYLHAKLFGTFLLGAFTSDFINFTRHFNGTIEEARVWKRALCPAQLLNNLNCQVEFGQYLAASYSFNQGLASCNNPDEISLLIGPGHRVAGTLHNFTLNGPASNWVGGHVSGACEPFNSITVTCPNPITVYTEAGQCSAIVNFEATASSDCSSATFSFSYSQEPGTAFPVGYNYVFVLARNEAGNEDYCSFPVNVIETVPPVIVTKNASVYLNVDGYAFIDNSTVIESFTDNCGISFAYVYPSYFDNTMLGENIVTIVGYDQSFNQATVNATVTVYPYEETPPVTSALLQKNNSSSAKSSPGKVQPTEYFNATVIPNPSRHHFSMRLQSSNKSDKINIRVMDIAGRLIEVVSAKKADEDVRFGQRYKAGIYIAEVTQGQQRKVVRLIKE